jgi:hypothetical protein
MMDARAPIWILLCGVVFLIGGCGAVIPLPSQGNFDVLAKGDSAAVCSFAIKMGNVCGTVPPIECNQAHPELAKVEEVFYKCSDKSQLNASAPQFATAYAEVLKERSGEGGAGMKQEQTHASSTAAADPVALELVFTTGTSCVPNTCGGGAQFMWVIPCLKRCGF